MAYWRLRELAEPERWNARKLALATGLAYGTVWGLWALRSTRVDLATLEKLAAVLHVAPGDLIGDSPPEGGARGEAATAPAREG